jgi:hypothetical protein
MRAYSGDPGTIVGMSFIPMYNFSGPFLFFMWLLLVVQGGFQLIIEALE